MTWLYLAVAGGLGAAARVAIAGWVHRRWREPFGTVAVNVAGTAGLAGFLAAGAGPDTLFIVATGLFGGLTTFSTWMVDTVTTASRAGPWVALRHAAVLTIAAVALTATVLALA